MLPYDSSALAEKLLAGGQRILLVGEAGIGKSTLMHELARTLSAKGRQCHGISADPGSPVFGLPGTVSLGLWREDGWQVLAYEALCSLDAGRFRLPLVGAVKKLGEKPARGLLLVDAPGVVRDVAGAECVMGLVESLAIDTVLVLARQSKPLPLLPELQASDVRILAMETHPQARRPGKKARDNKRTRLWRAHFGDAKEINLDVSELNLLGTPPPLDVADAWAGRQCAFLQAGKTIGIGEIIALQADSLRVRLPRLAVTSKTLLVRDACIENGLLVSAKPFAAANLQFLPPPEALPYPTKDYGGGPRPAVKLRGVYATLINGVFGDPLLHLRLQQQQRSLLFDLGDSGRLPTRIAHQVSDVFISHAHIDHIGGFLWLLRSRLGDFSCCRLFGPPGLLGHIKGLIAGILWDRVGDTGPLFEIAEIHGACLRRTLVQVGYRESRDLPDLRIIDGRIVDEPSFIVRTVTLDHGTPVQAYAFESKAKLSVDKSALKTLNLPAGPWLKRLKSLVDKGDRKALITLPGHGERQVGEFAEVLLTETPGEKLVYATDFAASDANREALAGLAHKADVMFCEASFLEADSEQARRTGHLTTQACGNIATLADVTQLVPFHFSKRYEKCPETVYREISDVCSRVVSPK